VTRRATDTYTEVLDTAGLKRAWKDTPKSLAEQDRAWDKADRLEQQREARAARRTDRTA
jgi:hypothetical protein